MNISVNEIYIGIVCNKKTISETMALALAYAPLTQDEQKWIELELQGYQGKTNVPDYRQLPCEVKVRVLNNYNGIIEDKRLIGDYVDNIDSMLAEDYGLSLYKIYVSQGVESIERQVMNQTDGNIIMIIDGPPGRIMIDSLESQSQLYNFTIKYVFQTAPVAYMSNALFVIKNRLIKILQKHINKTESRDIEVKDIEINRKTVFISYCWENEEHKKWVKQLANDLGTIFNVKIDQELPYGVELTHFMEQAIAQSDKVLIVVTPEYKYRADNRERGVGYETSLITDDLVNDLNRIKFIPIIRQGTKETSYPIYLGSKKGADMTNDSSYSIVLAELIRNIQEY